MSYIEQITTINRAAIRCGTHDKSLQQKKFVLKDAVDFSREVLKEIESDRSKLQVVELAGILTWTTLIVTDIIQDATRVTPTGRASAIALKFLEQLRGKTASLKFEHNRYKVELERIDDISEALKALWPAGESVINTFANLARNSYGLVDHMQSSEETKLSNDQQRRMMIKRLRDLQQQLSKIEQKIRDDSLSDDGQSGPRMSISPRLAPGRLP